VASSTDTAPLISLWHCSVILDGQVVLDDVSFALRSGERWALVGPNGAGKTMLLKLLRGDVWPTHGMGERRSYRLGGEESAEPAGLKHLVAYVGPERQDKYVRYSWNLTVAEVVTTGLFDEDVPLTRPSPAERARAARVMRRFGLWGLRARRMLTLSYGQRRLALVARAFASHARVLLLDEVFNGLDTRVRDKLRRALERPRGGHEWVLTSHRPQELPRNVTHVARMARGRILEAGARPHPTLPRGRGRGRSLMQRAPTSSLSRPRVAESTPKSPLPRPRGRVRVGAKLKPQPPFIAIRNATLYRDYRPVIRNLDWTIARGEHWAVLGPNGSGKSTLLSFIYGDLHAALGGEILREGHARGARIEAWKRRVGWLSPELQADHYLARSIEEVVIAGRYASVGLNAPPTRSDRAHARRWLRFFGIEDLRERGPRQVSYGQMRLALIARAMVNEPELLLLDEPCAGLDGDVRTVVLEVLEQLARGGTQLIMAVHDREDIVPAIRRVVEIRAGGRVVKR
jgi:molybdate transport system ATP-binding protein